MKNDPHSIEQVIRGYLPDILHMSLATCIEGQPWVCEVHFGYDDQLCLYFRSLTSSRHCQEIAINPKVAGNIVTQHMKGQKPRGIYFEGMAQVIDDMDERHSGYLSFSERMGMGPEILDESAGKKFYRISVTDFYIFDARESTPAQKYHLAWR